MASWRLRLCVAAAPRPGGHADYRAAPEIYTMRTSSSRGAHGRRGGSHRARLRMLEGTCRVLADAARAGDGQRARPICCHGSLSALCGHVSRAPRSRAHALVACSSTATSTVGMARTSARSSNGTSSPERRPGRQHPDAIARRQRPHHGGRPQDHCEDGRGVGRLHRHELVAILAGRRVRQARSLREPDRGRTSSCWIVLRFRG
jgi:hypothetical protein